jgi:hypothetical protein
LSVFNFFKKGKKSKKDEFKEKTVVCEDVSKELLKISKAYDIPLSSLDFEILSVKTYIKTEEEYILADKETLGLINSTDFLTDENNEIKQVYEIKIKKYVPDEKFEINGEIKHNKLLTKAVFVLYENSKLEDYTERRIYDELNKKKLKNGLLIGLFDDEMKKDIKKLSKTLLEEEKLKKPFTIRLCRGIDPVETRMGEVKYYIVEKKGFDKELFTPVKENQIIIEIIKPKKGKNGRDCRGKIIKAQDPENFKIPEIKYDKKTVIKEEDEDKIIYKTLKEGYIKKEDGFYVVKDEMEINQINLRTGNVKNAHDKKIKLEVKEKSVLKEAVADNMTVESKTLIIRGNVGNKAKIKSQNLTIEGQTHKNSVIEATIAKINKHKGKVKGKNIQINSLEGGFVKGENIIIKSSIGGTVIGHRVKIKNLKSHTKVYALSEIIIENISGEENLFSINPLKVMDEVNIEELLKKKEEIIRNQNIVKRELDKVLFTIKQNRHAYEDLKSLYEYNKQRNRQTDPLVLMKLKEFKVLMHKKEKLSQKYENLKKEEETIAQNIDNIQNAVYNAKIFSLSPWTAYNRIEFDLLEPPVKLRYDTKGGEGACGFKLKFDGEYIKIVKIRIKNDSGTEG